MKTKIIDEIIRKEAGYVNNKNDSGGATNFGITEKVARNYGYSGDMKDLPRQTASRIYVKRYWDSVRGDDLALLSERVCAEVVDTAVNMGPGTSSRYLQRCLSVMTDCVVDVDGYIGGQTLHALKQYLSKRDEETLLKGLNVLQGEHYIHLAESRSKDKNFIYGWIKQRISLNG